MYHIALLIIAEADFLAEGEGGGQLLIDQVPPSSPLFLLNTVKTFIWSGADASPSS